MRMKISWSLFILCNDNFIKWMKVFHLSYLRMLDKKSVFFTIFFFMNWWIITVMNTIFSLIYHNSQSLYCIQCLNDLISSNIGPSFKPDKVLLFEVLSRGYYCHSWTSFLSFIEIKSLKLNCSNLFLHKTSSIFANMKVAFIHVCFLIISCSDGLRCMWMYNVHVFPSLLQYICQKYFFKGTCYSRWILDESYHKKMLINVYYILYFFDAN